MTQLHFVAIGGTMRAYSSTERALRKALTIAEERGARTTLLAGAGIDFPSYAPENPIVRMRHDAMSTSCGRRMP